MEKIINEREVENKDEVMCVVIVSNNYEMPKVEDPSTYAPFVVLYKKNVLTGHMYINKVPVKLLLDEKTAIAKSNARITTFRGFLQSKYDNAEIVPVREGESPIIYEEKRETNYSTK